MASDMAEIQPTRRFENVVSPAYALNEETLRALPAVTNLLAFALPAGMGDHHVLSANARAWRDLNVTGSAFEERSAWEIAVGLCENHKLGTPFLKRNVVEEPHTYAELLERTTTRDGKPNTNAYENASSASRGSTQYNPRVAARYQELLETREARMAGDPDPEDGPTGATSAAGVPTTREGGETFADIAALLGDVPAPTDDHEAATQARRLRTSAALSEGSSGWAEEVATAAAPAPSPTTTTTTTTTVQDDDWSQLDSLLGGDERAQSAATSAPSPHATAPLPDGDGSMMAHERTLAMTRAAIGAVRGNSAFSELQDKLTILFVPLFDEEARDSTDKPLFWGLLMLLLVHDPLWNPGVGILELEENLRKVNQLENVRGGMSDRTVADLKFRYEHLPEQNFLNYLIDQNMYRALCQTYVGSDTPLSKDERDVSLLDHAAHPFRIFTLDRAIERLRTVCSGQVETVLRQLESVQDGVTRQAAQSTLQLGDLLADHVRPHVTVYRMDQQDCVWYARNGTGLSVQFLPWEDGTIALPAEPDDPPRLRRALEALEQASQGAGGMGRRATANPAVENGAERANTAEADGSATAPLSLEAQEREAIERQIQQFRHSAHAASYDTILGNVLEVRRADVNWCVAMGELYVPVREAFEQALPALPGGDATRAAPSLAKLTAWTRARERPCQANFGYRQAGLRLFEGAVWKPDAVLPPCLLAIVKFHLSGGLNGAPGFRKVSVPVPLQNRFCDLAANSVLYDGRFARYNRRNVNATKEVVMLRHFVYNAYYSNGKLSNNKMATGPAGVGKSYEHEELMAVLIEDSYVVVMSETSFANLSNADFSDHITFYDEMPYHIVASGKTNDKNGQGSRTKSMLTTGQDARRTVEMVKTASGVTKRLTRIVRSWQEGCNLIASNISVKDVDPAIVSRFLHEIYADTAGDEEFLERLARAADEAQAAQQRGADRYRKGVPSIIELQTGQVSAHEKKKMAAYVKNRQIEQTLVALYYKNVKSGVLPEPTMTVCDLLVGKLIVVLRQMGVKMGNYRKYERVLNQAHAMTVTHALQCAFHNQYGGDWRNREFSTPDLAFILPYLYCTKQIALLAFTSLLDDFINPMQGAVLRGLYDMARFPVTEFRGLLHDDETAGSALETLATQHKNLSWRRLDEDTLDLNYVAIKGNLYEIANQLGAHMKIKPSSEDIAAMLKELTATLVTIDAVEPFPLEDLHGGALATDALPRAPQAMPVIIQERNARGGGYSVCLCVEAFRIIRVTDVLRQALHRLLYRGMAPQTFVLGTMTGDRAQRGEFDTFDVTAEMLAAPGVPESFTMRSGDYVEEDIRHQLYMPYHSHDADAYGDDGELLPSDSEEGFASDSDLESAEGLEDPDDDDDDAMDVVESADDDDDSEAAEAFCRPVDQDYESAFQAMLDHLNQGRQTEVIAVREDLDEYGAFLHFSRVGLPLVPHTDEARAADTSQPVSQRVQWAFRNPETGATEIRDLPTPARTIAAFNEGLGGDHREVLAYNHRYRHSPDAERHTLPVPPAPPARRTARHPPPRAQKRRTIRHRRRAPASRAADDSTTASSVRARATTASATETSSGRKRARPPTKKKAPKRAPPAKKAKKTVDDM